MDKINKELILYSLQTNFYYTCIQNGKTICILLEQDEYLYYFMETIELVNEIISSKPPYFIYQKHALFYPLKKSSVTKDVITKMDQIHSLNGINSYFHYHKKHPYFTLFVDQLNSFERDCQYYQSREDAITNFIEAIKKEATSKAIKQALYKLKASVKKNYSSLHNYVHQLMDIYPNLSIIRLDLHYNFTGDFSNLGQVLPSILILNLSL